MRNLQGRWFGPNTIASLHQKVLSATTLLEVNKILGGERILAMDLPTHSGEVLL